MTDPFENEVDIISNKSNYSFLQVEDVHAKNICMVYQHEGKDFVKKFTNLVRNQYKCQTCTSRMKQFVRLSNGLKPLLFSPRIHSLDSHYIEWSELNQEICKTKITRVKILVGDTVHHYQKQSGPFDHYFISIPSEKQSSITHDQARLYEKAIERYVPSILPRMVMDILNNGDPSTMKSMKKSLQLFKTCLPKIPYGNKMDSSVDWLMRIVDYYQEHTFSTSSFSIDYIRILFWTPIDKDGMHGAVSPLIQQCIHNILPLLSDAKNEKALIQMLTSRLSPQNYQRPSTTKSLSNGQITNAIHHLGSFVNTLMTWNKAKDTIPNLIIMNNTKKDNSMTAFENMRTVKSKKPYSFASRAVPTSFSSIDDFISYLRVNPETCIEIHTHNTRVAYLAQTTIDPSVICVPHFWAFQNGQSVSYFNLQEWEEVKAVVPMYEYIHTHSNLLFVVRENEKVKTSLLSNCCFPEFLSVQYRRLCRDAFERLNREMKLQIPDDKDIMVGIGVSKTNSYGKLNQPLRIRMNKTIELIIH